MRVGSLMSLLLLGTGGLVAANAKAENVSFLDVTSEQNPWNRDTDRLPSSPDDRGAEAAEGSLRFLLVTSYQGGTSGTGKVWVVPESNPSASFVLVSGLDAPTGVCYDKNNAFLYVVDTGLGDADGQILQMEIDTDLKSRFVLANYIVATIYTGPNPFDCSVDAYGNLYFVDSQANSVNLVSYLDLWSGFVGQETTLYLRTNDNQQVSAPVAIEVYDSRTVVFVNNADPEDAGLVNEAPARTRYMNQATIRSDVRVLRTPWGLAVTSGYIYYTTDDGTVWAYRRGDPNLFLKSDQFSRPRGICHSRNSLYVVDNDYGEVFRLPDGSDSNSNPRGIVRIQGAYEVYCVNN